MPPSLVSSSPRVNATLPLKLTLTRTTLASSSNMSLLPATSLASDAGDGAGRPLSWHRGLQRRPRCLRHQRTASVLHTRLSAAHSHPSRPAANQRTASVQRLVDPKPERGAKLRRTPLPHCALSLAPHCVQVASRRGRLADHGRAASQTLIQMHRHSQYESHLRDNYMRTG